MRDFQRKGMRGGGEQKSEDRPQKTLTAEGNEADTWKPNWEGRLNEEESVSRVLAWALSNTNIWKNWLLLLRQL